MALSRPFLEQVMLPAVFVLLNGIRLSVDDASQIGCVPMETAFEPFKVEKGRQFYREVILRRATR